ncbi:hypothetical protein ACVOMV_23040 [Mesorhizobium atlanticum]
MRRDLLAGAGFAGDQDRQVVARVAAQKILGTLDAGRFSKEITLCLQPAFCRPSAGFNAPQKIIHGERLGHEVRGAEAH